MKIDLADAWTLVKQSVSAWNDDSASSMGASLAYYTVFSISPLLLIVISVAGLFFGREAVEGQVVAQLGGLMGTQGAEAVQGLLQSASEPSKSIGGTIVGVVLLALGATTVFNELQNALDRIFEAPARAKSSGIWSLLRTRLLSFGLVLGLGFLSLVSLVLSAALSAMSGLWGGADDSVIAEIVNHVVSLALSTVLFAMIYRFMPRVKVEWHDVWIGAFVTAVLFEVGKFAIGLYIGKSAVASGFGAAGSLVVLLVWVYYSAQIFLLGAEFTWVYQRSHGSQAASAQIADLQRAGSAEATAASGSGESAPAAARAPSPNGLQADGPYIPVEPVATDVRPVGIAFVAGLVAGVMVFVRPVRNLVLDATFGRKFATDIDARIERLRGR
ncbi:MAG: YihY/virulence factor BrkB family protein [Burkholderiales bacterium]